MVVRGLLLLLGVLMSGIFPFQAEASSEDVQITRLKNGLTVYIYKDDRFPLVSTRLYVHAGSAYETEKEAGISHLLEHMVFKGTEQRPKGAVAQDVEAAGGYLNAATSFDYTVYLTDLPAAHWKLGMAVVKDMAFHATLDPQELEAEKDVVISELQRGKDSPSSRIFEMLQASVLKGTGYARPIIGFPETIRAITRDDIRAYIGKYYQPQSMLLCVVGNVEPDKVLEEAQRLFGNVSNTTDLTPPEVLDPRQLGLDARVTVQRGPWKKVYVALAFPVPGDTDSRSIPLDVLAYLLGGDGSSYLYQKYKYEKQLVDSIDVGNFSFERVGLFYITAALDADKLEAFWKTFLADLASLKAKDFSREALERARLNLEDSVQRSKETLSGLASWKGRMQFFLGGEQGERNMLTALRAVDEAQIQQVLEEWIRPERLNVSLLAPQEVKLPDLAAMTASLWPAPARPAARAAAAQTGKVEKLDLGQGRTLVLIPDTTLPYTSVDVIMSGGDTLLAPGQEGLGTLTARVLTSGAAGRNAPDMERYLSDRAASLEAMAGRQVFGISMRQPARFNTDMFQIFRETLQTPNIDPQEVAREKTHMLAAIRSRADRPLELAFSEIPPFLHPGHPYGYRPTGTEEEVQRYTAEDIRHFWQRQVRQPWTMAVAGDFDRDAVIAFARSLPVPQDAGVSPAQPAWGTEKALKLSVPGRQQAHLMLIFKTVPLDHKDAPGLALLQNILAGQSGLLFRQLRDVEGLGYTVTAFNSVSQKSGHMSFYIGTTPEKLAAAKEGFMRIIKKLHEAPLPEAELQSGRNQMEGDYYRSRQSLASRSSEAATLTVLGRDLDAARQQIAAAGRLTPQDVQKLARTYLTLDDFYTVTVLP